MLFSRSLLLFGMQRNILCKLTFTWFVCIKEIVSLTASYRLLCLFSLLHEMRDNNKTIIVIRGNFDTGLLIVDIIAPIYQEVSSFTFRRVQRYIVFFTIQIISKKTFTKRKNIKIQEYLSLERYTFK